MPRQTANGDGAHNRAVGAAAEADWEEDVSEEDERSAKLIELAERKAGESIRAGVRAYVDAVMVFGSATAKISWSDVNSAISFDLVHPEGFEK